VARWKGGRGEGFLKSSSPVSTADCTSLAEWRPTSAGGEGGGGGVRRSRGSMERRAGRGFSEEKKWTASSICNNLKDFFLKKHITQREGEHVSCTEPPVPPQGCIAHGV